jgi:hypothetical protein
VPIGSELLGATIDRLEAGATSRAEVEAMSIAVSISTQRRCGVAGVCRIARAGV